MTGRGPNDGFANSARPDAQFLHPRPSSDIFLRGGRTGVLLIHGLGGTPVELKLVARGLHAAGHTVHCCTLAGHCGTEEDLAGSRWTDWFASVDAAFVRLRQECDHVFVGGLSMGGILALQLAARRQPQVRGLLLYAPTLWYDGWSIPWYRPLLKLMIHTPFGRRYRFVEREPFGIKDPRIRERVAAEMMSGDSAEAGLLGTPAVALRELWRLVAVVRRQLHLIRTPTLLVQSREDDISSLSNSEHLMRHLGGLVDLTVLDNSYHIVTIDQQRSIVIDRTIRFMVWSAATHARLTIPSAPATTLGGPGDNATVSPLRPAHATSRRLTKANIRPV